MSAIMSPLSGQLSGAH